jgi:hypothetical protein
VILSDNATGLLSRVFQLEISGIFFVIVGSLAKLFTPEAKNKYATKGSINNTNSTSFFFIFCFEEFVTAKIKKRYAMRTFFLN